VRVDHRSGFVLDKVRLEEHTEAPNRDLEEREASRDHVTHLARIGGSPATVLSPTAVATAKSALLYGVLRQAAASNGERELRQEARGV